MRNRERFFWIALLVALGIGARQAYTLIEYPPTKSGLICVGAPAPFDCEFPPVTATGAITATPGPRPSETPTTAASPTTTLTRSPTASRTASPVATATHTLAPSATALPPLLVNGDFEQPNHAGWTFVNLWRDTAVFNDERGDPRTRDDGAQSLRVWNNHRCVMAVVYQSVAVARFETFEFSAWGRTWASEGVFPEGHDQNVHDGISVGIDPNGGTSPTSSGVIWVEDFDTDEGARVTVRATALSSRITVFIRTRVGVVDPAGTACQWPHTHMMSFVDGARLAIAATVRDDPPEESAMAAAVMESASPTPTPATPPTEPAPSPYPQPTGYP